MHVIKREPFEIAKALYPQCSTEIEATYRALKASKAVTPLELKKIFPSLDNFKYVDKWYVIDIGHGKLRLIAFLEFKSSKCFIKYIVSHIEYEKITDAYRTKGKYS